MNNLQTPKPRLEGTALLSALLLVVFIASTISLWIMQTRQYLKQEQQISENLQTWQLEEAANIWAVDLLKNQTFKRTTPILAKLNSKHLIIPRNWSVKAELVDAQSFFNINNLTEQAMQISFVLLMQNVLKTATAEQIKKIFDATLAWIAPNTNPAQAQMYNQLYQQASPPYQAAGQAMASLSEWKKVAGVTPVIYRTMAPYLSCLPETTPINLNTSPPALLKALKPGLSDEDIKKILFARGKQGFKNNAELFAILEQLKLPVQNTTVNSQYFYLDIQIISPHQKKTFQRNLFYRPLNKPDQTTIVLLQRSKLPYAEMLR